MAFQLSPGVNVSEIDLTTVVPAVATSVGAIAGVFRWGPIGERILVDTENSLIKRFGKPTSFNAETWFTAANFLSYGNSLYISRAANTTFNSSGITYSAVGIADGGSITNTASCIVKNETDYQLKDGTFESGALYIAKYPGALGNSLRVAVCDNPTSYQSNVTLTNSLGFKIGQKTANTLDLTSISAFSVGDKILAGNSTIGQQYLQIKSISTNGSNAIFTFTEPYRLHTDYSSTNIVRNWEFINVVGNAPGTSDYVAANGNTSAKDEVHIVVVDEGGSFTGMPGNILEVYSGLSRATDSKTKDNTSNYYKDVINQNSAYIWWANDRSNAASANAMNVSTSTTTAPANMYFTLGVDGYDETSTYNFGAVAEAYNLFASAEDVDVSLVLQGRPLGGDLGGSTINFQLANYIIDNICETRKDCVALISPDKGVTLNAFGTQSNGLVRWRNALRSTSYAVMDSGYKYQYDRYNDVYRWIPLNGDIAGLCVRTDQTNDAWWSPAGFNRGQIKNIIKLAYNPNKAERDVLYSKNINPVVTFPGQGTVLYGDKTLQTKPSAFDRINVRRLFIVLEKAIATAAKYSLFEFNDAFTRSQFKNLVTPYLRNIQGRRGITDFLVVCDETNNTPQVIDSNQFVGDIYIKPARSINFIQLNFVAVATGVQFSEVVGKF